MKKQSFPLWLLCLLIFAVMVAVFSVRIPRTMSRSEIVASSDDEPAVSPELTDNQQQAVDGGTVDSADDSEPAAISAPGSEPSSLPSQTETQQIPEPGISSESELTPAPVETSEAVIVSEPEPSPSAETVHVHHYKNGVCEECGARPSFESGFLPMEYYAPADKTGTVTAHEYTVTAYANHGEGQYQKRLNVYLPWGYTEEKKYNVLVLIPGSGGDENSWLTTEYPYGDISMCGRVIFDRMFENGLCEPCIIVCPQVETNLVQGLTAGIYQMRDELRNDILPWVAETYSTWADDGTLESLQKARSHFGLGGLSNGALFVFEGGMRYNFDIFGSYAAFSGNGEPWNTLDYIQTGEWNHLPIDCLFTGAGTLGDWQQNYTKVGFEYLVENDERLTEGVNAWRVDVEGGHEWKVWLTGIYNALQVMFQG